MEALSASLVNRASAAPMGTVQAAASVSVLKQALDAQAASTLQLLQSLPQPSLAPSGNLGALVDTYA